jgi:hypothetical protein
MSPGRRHEAIAGCLGSADPPKRICSPILLDTGAPQIDILSANAVDLSGWNAGVGIEMLVPKVPGTVFLPGVLPYFDFAVLYDAEKGVIAEATGIIRTAQHVKAWKVCQCPECRETSRRLAPQAL